MAFLVGLLLRSDSFVVSSKRLQFLREEPCQRPSNIWGSFTRTLKKKLLYQRRALINFSSMTRPACQSCLTLTHVNHRTGYLKIFCRFHLSIGQVRVYSYVCSCRRSKGACLVRSTFIIFSLSLSFPFLRFIKTEFYLSLFIWNISPPPHYCSDIYLRPVSDEQLNIVTPYPDN